MNILIKKITFAFLLVFVSNNIFAQKSCPEWKWVTKEKGVSGGVAADAAGNIYWAGPSLVAKYNGNGQKIWSLNSKSNDLAYKSEATAIHLDAAGNIYVAGSFTGTVSFGNTTLTSTGDKDVFISKIDTSGKILWTVNGGGTGSDYAKNISADTAGNVYISGNYSGSARFGSTNLTVGVSDYNFIAKLNKDGIWQWALSDVGYYINVDRSGNIYVTCWPDARLKSLNTDGQLKWEFVPGGSSNSRQGMSISIDKNENILYAGYFNNTVRFGTTEFTSSGGYEIFVAKLNKTGQLLWAVNAGGIGHDWATGITTDDIGNIYISGYFGQSNGSSANFGNISLSSNGSTDIYVAKLNSSGQWQWATNAGGTGSDMGLGITTKVAGKVYVTGVAGSPASFGNINLTGSGFDPYLGYILDEELKVNAGSNQSILCGNSIKLNASGVGFTEIIWSPQNGLDNPNILMPTASPLSTTTYSVKAKNRCGEEVNSQVTVNINPSFQAIATVERTIINCGESTKLNAEASIAGQMTYTWSPATGLSNPNIADPIAKPANTTNYKVTATSSNGCSASANVTITVNNPNPPAVGLTTSTGEKYFCNKGLILSAGSGFASYKWNTGATTQSITPTQPGTYTVEIIDQGGCGNKDSITLILLTKIKAPDGPYLCADQPNASVRLDAGPGFDSYHWSNGQQSQSLTVTSPGTYSVKVTKGSCEYTDQIQVMNHPGNTTAEFSHQSNGLKTQFTALTQGIRFVDWNFGDGNNSSAINPEHTFAQPGTYTVCLELTDFCGATDKKCKSITVSGSVGIKEEEKVEATSIKVFPNPSAGLFTVENKLKQRADVRVYDATGRIIDNFVMQPSGSIKLDYSHLSPAVYIMSILTEKGIMLQQLVITK